MNFSTLITAGPTTHGLTTAQANTYRNLHNAYATALAACRGGGNYAFDGIGAGNDRGDR